MKKWGQKGPLKSCCRARSADHRRMISGSSADRRHREFWTFWTIEAIFLLPSAEPSADHPLTINGYSADDNSFGGMLGGWQYNFYVFSAECFLLHPLIPIRWPWADDQRMELLILPWKLSFTSSFAHASYFRTKTLLSTFNLQNHEMCNKSSQTIAIPHKLYRNIDRNNDAKIMLSNLPTLKPLLVLKQSNRHRG